ncbi:unknown [Bacteroides sp. CAG:443]|nr:unknown [Bacteroides sp. CAG:443]
MLKFTIANRLILAEKESIYFICSLTYQSKCFLYMVINRMNGDMKLVGYVFILHAIPFVQQKHFPATVGQ